MSDDGFGPGLDARDFVHDLARGLGMDNEPGFRAMQLQLQQRAETDRAMATTVLRLFSSRDGEKVLNWLIDNTLRKDEVPIDLVLTHTPEQVQAYSLVRAGENSAVKLILTAMAQAQQKRSRRRKAV